MLKITLIALLVTVASACSTEHPEPFPPTGSASSVGDHPWLPIPAMSDYIDPHVGYQALVPLGWRRVDLDSGAGNSFSVTFESPPSNAADQFADYLLIEISPVYQSPGFAHPPSDRTEMVVDGDTVFRERFALKNHPVGETNMDLVAWQISLIRPGYAVSMYAVGEQREDARLERILVQFAHSFSLQGAPFQVS